MQIFAIPVAFIIPPQLIVFQIQLGFLYQIWLHNEVTGDLGFIELLINSPRQHRIHHGKNRSCIDKNYGTFLMIWDRLFGTYQSYKDHVRVGLVGQTPQTYDSMSLHFGHYKNILCKFIKIDGLANKVSVILKGPGWEPGTPRLGIIDKVPEYYDGTPKYGYDRRIPYWKKFYALIHLSLIILAFIQLVQNSMIVNLSSRQTRYHMYSFLFTNQVYTNLKGFIGIAYVIFFLTTIGAIFDDR